jgi:1-acyl-sn-glycerol-3-phosphate acyltransferase
VTAAERRTWRLLRIFLKAPVLLLLRPVVHGREHVPRSGPLLLVSNHESFWDIPLLGAVQPRDLRFMAKAELFRFPLFGSFMRAGGTFAVRRGEADREALRVVHDAIGGGDVVAIFLQGHRQAELDGAKAGAGRCAVVEETPVVPVAISGTGSWRPGRRTHVSFGAPRSYDRDERRPAEAYRETADELMAEIRQLHEPGR